MQPVVFGLCQNAFCCCGKDSESRRAHTAYNYFPPPFQRTLSSLLFQLCPQQFFKFFARQFFRRDLKFFRL